MENAAEALKIAFAVMMFVLALGLCISSFSQATQAVDAVVSSRDRDGESTQYALSALEKGEEQYIYVTPTEKSTRTVGIETVVSSIYRVYEEDMEIHFFDSNGTPIYIYQLVDSFGTPTVSKSYIDLSTKGLSFGDQKQANLFFDVLVGGTDNNNITAATLGEEYAEYESYIEKYKIMCSSCTPEGLYEKFKNTKFTETLGEYEDGTMSSKITKRVITYTIVP